QVLEPFTSATSRFFSKESMADFIVSNPPYLASGSEMDSDVFDHEPHGALLAPTGDPLYFYRSIVEGAEAYLKPDGAIFFECPHERIDAIAGLFSKNWKISIYQDLTHRSRVIRAEWKGVGVLN